MTSTSSLLFLVIDQFESETNTIFGISVKNYIGTDIFRQKKILHRKIDLWSRLGTGPTGPVRSNFSDRPVFTGFFRIFWKLKLAYFAHFYKFPWDQWTRDLIRKVSHWQNFNRIGNPSSKY